MSTLILVRHGQATPFERDTDQLSDLGRAQGAAVGDALTAQGIAPTHVLHGPLRRQRLTAHLAGQGRSWPDAREDARLSEYDGDGLVRTLAPLLSEQDEGFAALATDFHAGHGTPDRDRAFQLMLERVAAAWQAGTVAHADVEGWAAFRERVASIFHDILALPSGSTVLAFTSGGVIGVMTALSLDAPDAAALRLNWRVRNGSVTRLTFGGGRISLDSFNEVHHLPPDLRSWR